MSSSISSKISLLPNLAANVRGVYPAKLIMWGSPGFAQWRDNVPVHGLKYKQTSSVLYFKN